MGHHLRKKELENCNFVKTILMVGVVFYHSIIFWQGDWFSEEPIFQAELLGPIALWLQSFLMEGFLLVSGYIFCYLKYEKGKYQEFGAFLNNKARRLLIPYIFVAACWVAPIGKHYFHYSWNEIVHKFIIIESPGQLWFLVMLFNLFAVFWLASDFCYRHDYFSGVLAVGLHIVGVRLLPCAFQLDRVCQYFLFFWMGFKIRQYGSDIIRKIPVTVWVFADGLLFCAQTILSGYTHIIAKILKLGVTFLLNSVGGIMAFILLQKIADTVSWKNNAGVKVLSKYSMVVYLVHQQIVYFFITGLNGAINPYLNAVVNFAGTMVCSLLLSVLLMRFSLTRTLVGEK